MKIDFNEVELRRLDLNLLLVFSALMRERSVTRAAQRLRVGAPAISMALGRLRKTFGDTLFVRTNASMEPTSPALELWLQLEPALARVEAAYRGTRAFDPKTSTRTLRLALPDDLEFVLLPLLLQRLTLEAPNIRLSVRPNGMRPMFERLDEGDADLSLISQPPRTIESRHRIAPLYRDVYAVLFDLRTTKGVSPTTADAYCKLPHVIISGNGELSDQIDDALAKIGKARNVIAAVSHYPTLPFILKRRPAIANVPLISAFYLAKAYKLNMVAPPIAIPRMELALAWHVRTDADPANAWLRQVVSRLVNNLATDARMGLEGRATLKPRTASRRS